MAQAVVSGARDAVSRQFSNQQPWHFHRVALRATLGGLELQPPHQPQRPDRVAAAIDFAPGPHPPYCYFMGVSDGGKSRPTKRPTLTVQSLATGAFVPHVRVPAVSSKNTSIRYEAVFFTPALLQGKAWCRSRRAPICSTSCWRKGTISSASIPSGYWARSVATA